MSLHCDLCGLDFDPECVDTSCTGCPLQRNCQHITCPRCGYVILPEPVLLRWLSRVGRYWQSKKTNFKERM